jgi:nucleoside-diphosphate-sugar epimerase
MSQADSPLSGRVVLVTGAAGFLGVHVAQELVAQQATVFLQDTGLKRYEQLAPVLASGRATFVPCDLRHIHASPGWRGILPPVDFLLHLSLRVPPVADQATALAQYWHSNLVPFRRLVSLLRTGLQGICLASSISVYEAQTLEPISEEYPTQAQSPYALMKLAMEQAALKFGARAGIPISILRYSTLYGPGETNSPRAIPSFIRNLLVGLPPVIYGDGTDVHDYLFVRDGAKAARLALEHLRDAPGIYNLGSGRGRSTRAIAKLIQGLMNSPLEPEFRPSSGPRKCIVANISRAEERLQFHPQTRIEEGIAAEIDSHRASLVKDAETFWFNAHGLFSPALVKVSGSA